MKRLLAILLLIFALFTLVSCDVLTDFIGTEETPIEEANNDSPYLYNDFSPSEKALFDTYIGVQIPFLPTNDYYVEGYYDRTGYEYGINYYTVGNTEEDFLTYLVKFANYALTSIHADDDGNTWYRYEKDDVVVEISYYNYNGFYYVDLLIRSSFSTLPDNGSGDNENNNNNNDNNDSDDDSGNGNAGANVHLYKDFTTYEKSLFTQYIGAVIPFLPNNEYYVEGYYDTDDYENGINFYTVGNTQAEFNAYLQKFSGYSLYETYEDDYGDTWYCYMKGDVVVDLAYYYDSGEWYVDVYVYSDLSSDGEDSGDIGGDSGNTGSGSGTNEHLYKDFTTYEKSLFTQYIGAVIPFIPNSEYYVEGYYDTDDYENGINFYTVGNTQAEFNAYLQKFSGYSLYETYEDDYGDTWYCYMKGDVVVDLAYYYDSGYWYVDVYVYSDLSSDGEGGSGGIGGDSGNTGSGSDSDYDVITNAGAGLPSDSDGVYDVNFTDADKVKDVTDQGYYLDGCPTTGSPAVLVIPVEFSDVTAASKGYSLETLYNAFYQNGTTDYYSVYDYYFTSSYGQLSLDITVLDFWFRPANKSTYYESATMKYNGADTMIGDQIIINEALAYLATIMDLSQFDSDGNGLIDSIILVNTLDVGEDDFHWAYRFWNIYTNSRDEYYEYDGVSANDYVWASFQFLYETTDKRGNVIYDDDVVNTYTFIHEFAHVLGTDDYYDTEYIEHPMDGLDVMDATLGDHNAYTKINLGWITSSRLVVANGSITLTLEDFSKGGDTIIIANNWDPKLGAYQEYYIIVYYTNNGLNAGDAGYFDTEGILVYHVNASIFVEDYEGEIYYDVYNTNTHPSGEYGTDDNLIEYVESSDGDYVYEAGEKLPTVTDDNGDKLGYTFTVISLDGEYATLFFTAA